MNCFEISKAYMTLANIIDIDENGEIQDASTYNELLAEIDATRDDKLVNIKYIKREVEAENELIANEIKRLQGRKKANDTKVERLEGLQLMLIGDDKVSTPFYTFSTRKSESVECNMDFEEQVDKRFWCVKEVRTPDKKAIKEAIKNGEVVKGATLKQNASLSVK